MKHLRLFESFDDIDSIEDKLSDLFIDFEDELDIKPNVQRSRSKVNEESSNDLLYDELSIDEFRIFLDSHNMIDFDEVELDYLSSIFGKYSLVSPFIAKRTDAKLFVSTTIMRELKIYKFDDEWYLIRISKGSWKDFGYESIRYKCDTFDGVKQFIEQNKLGKS